MCIQGRIFRFCFFVVSVFVVHTSVVHGQDIAVSAFVDSTHITLGDWLNLTVEVKHSRPLDVAWSQFRDTLGQFDIIHQDSVQREESGDAVREIKKFTLSRYDSGSFVIPPILIAYKSPADTAPRYAQSDPLVVRVSTVAIDTSGGFKDIKPPLSLPLTWKEIAFTAAMIALIAAAVVGIYYYRKKRRKLVEEVGYEAPKVPPHLQAIARLKELQEKRMWQQGDVKGFYSEATEIVREYFEGRYGIRALEMTSDEVFAQLKRFAIDADIMKSMEEFFVNADLVKFAKYMPVPSDNEAVIPQGLDIVERTKPVVEVPQNA